MLQTNASGDFSKGVDLIVAQELEVLENPRGLYGCAANLGYYHQCHLKMTEKEHKL